ncbi:MAG: hypothetical protein K9H64_18835 [Bacteroidales bacterium]|nr:hypothetical protein [Bacteroidales bacterium]
MLDIEVRKHKIIKKLKRLDDENSILRIENFINTLAPNSDSQNEIFKPMQKSICIEDMKIQQNYSGIDRTFIDSLIQEIDLHEPIEQLLAMD